MALRAIRFQSSNVREHCELAMCIPHSNASTTTVVYGDRDIVCDTSLLSKAYDVNLNTFLTRATVLHATQRDAPALRLKLPEYQNVRALSRASVACQPTAFDVRLHRALCCRYSRVSTRIWRQ